MFDKSDFACLILIGALLVVVTHALDSGNMILAGVACGGMLAIFTVKFTGGK